MKIVTLGELLLRLSPEKPNTLAQSSNFSAFFGGGEANVAVALAGLGEEAEFLTALPDNDLGGAALSFLKSRGVETGRALRKEGRMGLYFYEHGVSLRAGKVLYDRADSVFSRTRAEEYDLCGALEKADWLHLSGITPALGENAARLALFALKSARERGIATSFDVNYRPALWPFEEAKSAFERLLPYADVCIASSDGLDVLGLENAGAVLGKCERAARALKERYGLRAAAITVRESPSASRNRLSGCLLTDRFYPSDLFETEIVDRVGGGDAFSAGLIYAELHGFGGSRAVNFASACNAYKHTVAGDAMSVPAGEIELLMRGETRVRR